MLACYGSEWWLRSLVKSSLDDYKLYSVVCYWQMVVCGLSSNKSVRKEYTIVPWLYEMYLNTALRKCMECSFIAQGNINTSNNTSRLVFMERRAVSVWNRPDVVPSCMCDFSTEMPQSNISNKIIGAYLVSTSSTGAPSSSAFARPWMTEDVVIK